MNVVGRHHEIRVSAVTATRSSFEVGLAIGLSSWWWEMAAIRMQWPTAGCLLNKFKATCEETCADLYAHADAMQYQPGVIRKEIREDRHSQTSQVIVYASIHFLLASKKYMIRKRK